MVEILPLKAVTATSLYCLSESAVISDRLETETEDNTRYAFPDSSEVVNVTVEELL